MAMDGLARLGTSELNVTRLGFGCVPIANLYSVVSDEDSLNTIRAPMRPEFACSIPRLNMGTGLASTGWERRFAGIRATAF